MEVGREIEESFQDSVRCKLGYYGEFCPDVCIWDPVSHWRPV